MAFKIPLKYSTLQSLHCLEIKLSCFSLNEMIIKVHIPVTPVTCSADAKNLFFFLVRLVSSCYPGPNYQTPKYVFGNSKKLIKCTFISHLVISHVLAQVCTSAIQVKNIFSVLKLPYLFKYVFGTKRLVTKEHLFIFGHTTNSVFTNNCLLDI